MKLGLAGCLLFVLLAFALMRPTTESVTAQNSPQTGTNPPSTTGSAEPESTPPSPPPAENPPTEPAPSSSNDSSPPTQSASAAPNTAAEPPPAPETSPTTSSEDQETEDEDKMLLSFKEARIDMISQWLAEATGKSIVKHPQVNCNLTIISTKKLEKRDAIELVYQALALEGFNAIESANSIFLLPEGKQPKINPTLLSEENTQAPDSRQPVVKVFQLEHVKSGELKEKIKNVLSKTGILETDDSANKIIATDFAENVRLLSDLIEELDVVSHSDAVIDIFELKFAEASELSELLGGILNASASSNSASRSSSRRSPSRSGQDESATGIRLWADTATNRLIVSSPKARSQEIRRLVETLDSEKPTDVSVRVIPLHHVDSEELMREIAPLYRKLSGTSLKETIEVTANSRSNSLIVLSNESNYKAMVELIRHLDNENAQETTIKTFPLENADATDVAEQLRTLYQGGTSTSSRYTYVYNYSRSNSSDDKPSFVADVRRNAVVVQAPPSAIPSIEEMIVSLDEPITDDSLVPRIYQLKFVSAVDIEEVLNELFISQQQERGYFDFYYGYSNNNSDSESGRLFGKLKITSEPYSNSIIVTSNSSENLIVVENILKQLDVPSSAGETTLRVPLNFANSIKLANNVNILFAKGGSPALRQNNNQPNQPQQQNNNPNNQNNQQATFELEREQEEDAYFPWLGGQQDNFRGFGTQTATRPVSDLIGRVRVVPDARTNSLLITSNVHFLPQVLKLVNALDTPTAQVLIEAKIVEVSSDFRDKLGTRWSPDGAQVFDADDMDGAILGSGLTQFTKVFTGTTAADALKTGILDSSVNLDVLVQFLRRNTDANVMAEPQINVADNELGKLFVGAQVPFISGSLNTREGGRNDSFNYRDVGIILEVTPHINNSEEVALKIRVESSNIRNGETLFGGAILDTRSFRTDMVVKSGQTLVLGGIIQQELSDVVRKVPVLGDIPILGFAFKKRDKVERDVELMVFLRPVVTRSLEDVQRLIQEVDRKTPRIEAYLREHAEAKAAETAELRLSEEEGIPGP
jgi:type II secretion system protein D